MDEEQEIKTRFKQEREEAKFEEKKVGEKSSIGERVGGFLKKGFTTKLPAKERGGIIARKAIHVGSPKGSLVERLTKPKSKTIKGKKSGGKPSRGRGRPTGTFKVRVLPYSGRRVKVPTHIYKKMLSAEKAQYRLAKVKRQAAMQMQADQLAYQQDPRYQQGADDQFLADPDMQFEQEMQRIRAQQQIAQIKPQEPSTMRKVSGAIQNFGRGISRIGGSMGARRQIQVDQYGRQVQQAQPQGLTLFGGRMLGGVSEPRVGGLVREPGVGRLVREPRVTSISSQANLLKVSQNRRRLR
jgi:hypothetical protein